MGRGAKRVQKRAREAGEEFEVERDRAVEESLEAAKPDDELFFVDTEASVRPSPKTKAEKRRRFFSDKPNSTVVPSVHLVKAVEKMAKKIETGEIVVDDHKKKAKGKQSKSAPVYDIWGMDEKKKDDDDDDDEVVNGPTSKKGKKPKQQTRRPVAPRKNVLPLIERPMGGQSYNPTLEEHQEAIKKAVDVEEKREKALEEIRKPLGGMSEETKALLLSSDDEDDNAAGGSDDDMSAEEGETAGAAAARKIKRKGKLTRAERNRIRRRKEAEHAALMEKRKKELAKQVGQAGSLAKQLTKKERQAKAKEEKAKAKAAAAAAKGEKAAAPRVLPSDKNPLQARSVPVPLSDELGGGLRLVRTKGNLASETLERLQRRGEYEIVPGKKSARPKQRVRYVEKWRGE